MKTFKLRSKGLLLGLSLCSTLFLFNCGNDDKDTPTVLEVTADFEYSIDEETGATVTFTNKSENADTYAWDFGNGDLSNLKSPVVTYKASGNYDVKLTASNEFGSTYTIEREIAIYILESGDPCVEETSESLSSADLNLSFKSNPAPALKHVGDNASYEWVENPDFENQVNSSCYVAKITRGASEYANNQFKLEEKLNFNTNGGFKIKVWSPAENSTLTIKLERIEDEELENPANGVSTQQAVVMTKSESWEELTFTFEDADDTYDKIVLFFDILTENEGTYYFDDLALWEGDGGGTITVTEPTEAAPTPIHDQANVISIFSDAYTDISDLNLNPDWGQATQVTTESIDGNATLKYSSLNYQGTDFSSNTQDLTSMEYLHIDLWTADEDAVIQVTPINSGGDPNEFLINLEPINTGSWNSYDIPLTTFTDAGMTLDQVIQMKFDAQPSPTAPTIFLDNIYYYSSEAVASVSPYCITEVTHLGIEAEASSAIYLSIGKTAEQEMTIEIESADTDPVDLLIVNNSTGPITGSPAVSATNNTGDGKLSVTLTWSSTPPDEIELNLLWSKDSTPGNWQLNGSDITVQFEDTCDDIGTPGSGGGNGGGGSASEPEFPLDFENGETLVAFDGGATASNVSNPDTNGNTSANVLQFNKVVGSAWYSGVVFDDALRTTPLIDLANGSVFTVKVWSPNAGINMRFQLEGGVDSAPSYEVIETISSANQWVELTFDFSSQVSATEEYTRFSFFPDFDTSNQNPVAVEVIYYIDDITQSIAN